MAWSSADDDKVREFCKTHDIGKLSCCPKCGMGEGGASEMMLANFCTHKYCPFREYRKSKDAERRAADPYYSALDAWKKSDGHRPRNRPDGIPTRSDMKWMTDAEIAITKAMNAVENAGASPALTDAVTLLGQARDRVADHVEDIE